jgi:hypothetical protein
MKIVNISLVIVFIIFYILLLKLRITKIIFSQTMKSIRTQYFFYHSLTRAVALIFTICAVVIIVFLLSCKKSLNIPEKLGLLKISYQVNSITDPSPSYQTAVWLEDTEGNYLQTLFVSEWVSLGGYKTRPSVCPEWHTVANWDQNSMSEIYAVTGATPSTGTHELIIDCQTEDLSGKIYEYQIETHYVNKYNVLYSGSIEIGNKENTDTARVTYIPSKHPNTTATDVIGNVFADYYFDE